MNFTFMQVTLNAIRTLRFACSLVCLNLDITVYMIVDNYRYLNNLVYFTGFPSYDIYFICTDVLCMIFNGYYTITIERKWNKVPLIWDHVVNCVELILWIIYVTLKFNRYRYLEMAAIYGLINIFLYFIYAILLFRLARKLNLSRINNNAGVEMNNSGVEYP